MDTHTAQLLRQQTVCRQLPCVAAAGRAEQEPYTDTCPSPEVEVEHILARILIVFIGMSRNPFDHKRRCPDQLHALQHEGTALQSAGNHRCLAAQAA